MVLYPYGKQLLCEVEEARHPAGALEERPAEDDGLYGREATGSDMVTTVNYHTSGSL